MRESVMVVLHYFFKRSLGKEIGFTVTLKGGACNRGPHERAG